MSEQRRGAGGQTVAGRPELPPQPQPQPQTQPLAAEPVARSSEKGALPQVMFVDEAQLETITDKHYRTFSLPCAPFEERLKRSKR